MSLARRLAFAVVIAAGAILGIGSLFDLASDARGHLPGDHLSTFTAVTGTSWQHAASIAHPATRYVSRMEVAYAAYELVFALLFLTVAAIPLRRGERWAWWCSWLILVPAATFAAVFGANDPANLLTAIVVAIIAALALLVLRPVSKAAPGFTGAGRSPGRSAGPPSSPGR